MMPRLSLTPKVRAIAVAYATNPDLDLAIRVASRMREYVNTGGDPELTEFDRRLTRDLLVVLRYARQLRRAHAQAGVA